MYGLPLAGPNAKDLTLETVLIKLRKEQQKDTSHSKAYDEAFGNDVTKGKRGSLLKTG